MGTEEELQDALEDLQELDDVNGTAIVRRDGLMILSDLPSDVDSDQLAAMTASSVGSGEHASETLGIGTVNQVIVESEDGKLISTGAGDEAILAVLTGADINTGLVLVEMKDAAESIEEIL